MIETATKPDLRLLIARVEGAAGPDRALDVLIVTHLDPGRTAHSWEEAEALRNNEFIDEHIDPVTASIDSALALVERVLPGARVLSERDFDRTGWAMIQTAPEYYRHMASGETQSLAIIAALLRAMDGENV